MAAERRVEPGSFRDPCGRVFFVDGDLFRAVFEPGRADLEALHTTGLYDALASRELLVRHEDADSVLWPEAARVIKPERIPFVSYPEEWTAGQLYDAAVLTLDVMDAALDHGMRLKDASAFNVQFIGGRPVFIDTLSFVRDEGGPWVAYGQFLRHFLAPLALVAHTDARLQGLWRAHLDGVPVDLAARLLPRRTRFKPGLLTHLHMPAAAEARHAHKDHATAQQADREARAVSMSGTALRGLLGSLRRTVESLQPAQATSHWSGYGEAQPTYTDDAQSDKQQLLNAWLKEAIASAPGPAVVWDLGANTGTYSRLAKECGAATVVALEGDAAAAAEHYQRIRGHAGSPLPLCMDLLDPTPARGFAHQERASLAERGPADVVLVLALVHHLSITGHVPLHDLVQWLASLVRRDGHLLVEWVGPDDPQAAAMLANRSGPPMPYDTPSFEAALAAVGDVQRTHTVASSTRVLYDVRVR